VYPSSSWELLCRLSLGVSLERSYTSDLINRQEPNYVNRRQRFMLGPIAAS
jgi:hypothetical protein